MTEGKPGALILTFALPLMAGNVFQQLYTVVDTMVVGKVLGVSALAALGAAAESGGKHRRTLRFFCVPVSDGGAAGS